MSASINLKVGKESFRIEKYEIGGAVSRFVILPSPPPSLPSLKTSHNCWYEAGGGGGGKEEIIEIIRAATSSVEIIEIKWEGIGGNVTRHSSGSHTAYLFQ